MTKTPYAPAELDPVTAHPDQTGKLHWYSEDAIRANFDADVRDAIFELLKRDSYFEIRSAPVPVLRFVREYIKANPDHARILIGDRDYT